MQAYIFVSLKFFLLGIALYNDLFIPCVGIYAF